MDRHGWEERIISEVKEAGTYRPMFHDAIEALARILEKRDECDFQYDIEGRIPVVECATGTKKNPLLTILNELNTQALSYWRDLGLTPSGLKKIDESAMKEKKKNALAEALKELGG